MRRDDEPELSRVDESPDDLQSIDTPYIQPRELLSRSQRNTPRFGRALPDNSGAWHRQGEGRRVREDQWIAEIFQPPGVLTRTISSADEDVTVVPLTSRCLVVAVVVQATSP